MLKPLSVAALLAALCLPAAAGAAPNDTGAKPGKTVTTKTGCVTADPYALFEKVYREEGRVAAYKALVGTEKCQRLPSEMKVRLVEQVDAFDYGWGKGRIWRVTPVAGDAKAPNEFFIRTRVRD